MPYFGVQLIDNGFCLVELSPGKFVGPQGYGKCCSNISGNSALGSELPYG